MVDVSAITNAVDDRSPGDPNGDLQQAYTQIGLLADELAAKTAELDRLKGEQSIDQVRARLLEPYVNKVFVFVAAYCVTVGIFLFLAALPGDGFRLPDSILAIIAGSTAVSVIGLIGLVITGLFGSKKD